MTPVSPFCPSRFHGLWPNIFNPKYLGLVAGIARYCHPVEHRKAVRMFFRSLFWFGYSKRWFEQIAHSALLSELVKLERNLPEKLHRHYLRMDYPIKKRLQLITGHYQIMEQVLAPQLVRQTLLMGGLVLSRIEIDPDLCFDLILGYGGYPGKEGELAIFMRQVGLVYDLAFLSFNLVSCANGHAIYIGCSQGSNAPNSRELVGQASSACSGLSPKRILMEALFALAKQVGAKEILGVSDGQHISNRKVAKYFSYDDYWLEFCTVRNQNGDYALPLALTHKDMKDVPTKRRAKYRRQRALLEAIQQDTIQLFECQAASCADQRLPCDVAVNVILKQPHAETQL